MKLSSFHGTHNKANDESQRLSVISAEGYGLVLFGSSLFDARREASEKKRRKKKNPASCWLVKTEERSRDVEVSIKGILGFFSPSSSHYNSPRSQ